MTCKEGFCLVCGKDIAPECPLCATHKRGPTYTEIQMQWSNGASMSIAVCRTCSAEAVWKASKQEMTEAIWGAWDERKMPYSKDIVIV